MELTLGQVGGRLAESEKSSGARVGRSYLLRTARSPAVLPPTLTIRKFMDSSFYPPRIRGLLALLVFLVCGLAGASVAQAAAAPVITTVAGNGTSGYSGDNGPATSAKLRDPQGVAVDAAGNVFIADDLNSVIREVNASTGIITTVAGNGTSGYSGDNGPATSAELNGPDGVAVDASGNLFIAEYGNSTVREVNAQTGIITTVAGNGTSGYSGDNGPATSAKLSFPAGVAVDASGNLFIADYGNSTVREVNAQTGIITTVAGNGTGGYSGDGGPATSAKLSGPKGVGVDAGGNVFIADYGNNVIREVNASTGIITTVAGNGTSGYSGDGGPATSAKLGDPDAVAVDAGGNVFIADLFPDSNVREVNASTGIITTVAGNGTFGYSGDGGPATSAQLSFPAGVALDAHGNVFIADSSNNAIRKVMSPAAMSADRTSLDFGSVSIGQDSTQTTVTVTNNGGEHLNVGQASLGGANPGQFTITSDNCTNATVSAGDTCTIGVRFSPTAAGAQTAELDLPSNDPDSPTVIALSGTGTTVSQPAPPAPVQPAPPTKPVQPAPPTKPVERVSSIGQPTSAQQLMARGEKMRVYCNQACSLTVTLDVYYRALTRGTGYQNALHPEIARLQPWMRVTVGQATVKLAKAGYRTVVVKVAAAHRAVLAHAGSILLGVLTRKDGKLVSKHWLHVKGPDMNAKVQAQGGH